MADVTNQNNTITRAEVLMAIAYYAGELKENPADFYDMDELTNLRGVLEEADSATGRRADWHLIRDDHFPEWAEDYAGDMGPTSGWPYDCIDWTKAADALKQDYKRVDYDGATYWVRA
jgi:hypothetical protein